MGDEPALRVVEGGAESTPPLLSRKRGQFCTHRTLVLDHDARRVYCNDCEREVDAFDGLAVFENEQDRWSSHVDRAKREVERLSVEVKDLKREERNTKARLRRSSPSTRPATRKIPSRALRPR